MPSAIAVVGLVVCLSLLESLWTWLLVAAISEVAGQVHPPLLFLTATPVLAWALARSLLLADLPLERRRFILVGSGLVLAFAAATIHAGLVHPGSLIFGSYTPDLRGAGVTLLLVSAYLWARGLRLADRLGREQVINHVGVSAAGLAVVLVFLPLTDAIQVLGLVIVVASFLVAVASLLLIQLAGVQSRQLSRLHWAGVAIGASTLVLLASALLAGAFSRESLGIVGEAMRAAARVMMPPVEALLLAAGYGAQLTFNAIQFFGSLFGQDPETRTQNPSPVATPTLPEGAATANAPDILAVIAGVGVISLFLIVAIWLFYRLVGIRVRDDEDVIQDRAHASGPGLLGLLRGALGRWGQREPDDLAALEERRAAIRRHYRTFQNLMARAGLPRTDAQTPREFQAALTTSVPAATPAVEELTRAYVVARYAESNAELPDPMLVGESVHRVREALQSREPPLPGA